MGWFEEQLKERKKRDDESMSDAMEELAKTILHRNYRLNVDDRTKIKNAIDEILRYYRAKPISVPEDITELEDQLDYLFRPYGIMYRRVTLEPGWSKDATGTYLAYRTDGSVVALIPNAFGKYSFYDEDTKKRVLVTKKTQALLSKEAYCFYKPFPQKKLTIPALMRFIIESVSKPSIAMIVLLSFITTLIGMISPKITNVLFSDVIESQSVRVLIAIAILSVSVSIGSMMIGIIQSMINGKVSTQMEMTVEAATMGRLLSLPTAFFKKFSSGELSAKVGYLNSLCSSLFSTFAVSGLTSVMSLVYMTQIFQYAPALVLPSIAITLITIAFSCFTTMVRMKVNRKMMEVSSKKSGMTYSILTGIQKLKLSGSEKRAFTRWVRLYTEEIKNTYAIPSILLLSGTISFAISSVGSIIMYFMAIQSNVSVADYYSFVTAYGMVSGAFTSLIGIVLQASTIRPILDQVKPILEEVPEFSLERKIITKLSGNIELNNVSFRYSESMPNVVNNLSLKIKAGQYIAIVGKTGCGKTTLLRLLLGFEKPQKGAIYYDGKDINTLDLQSLRKHIGVVLQNGKLFQGDIFSNIVISAPYMTLADAWRAAEIAGIDEDIREMPMGMHTMISEGGGGISGGQKQRLMIARAVASNPRILMFDEATSALDNITQKKVSDSLDNLKCTRIVIAHRLSTIRHCDRIIMMDDGRIVEDGNYEELIAKKGAFYDLVERQRLDVSTEQKKEDEPKTEDYY